MSIYIAYGSNMDLGQMAYRCPNAKPLGKAILKNWRLMFKSHFATIERQEGYNTPILFWEIDDKDERALDRYEGYPDFYYKMNVSFDDVTMFNTKAKVPTEGMVYIMHEHNDFKLSSMTYYQALVDAYKKFDFDMDILEDALVYSDKKNSNKKA